MNNILKHNLISSNQLLGRAEFLVNQYILVIMIFYDIAIWNALTFFCFKTKIYYKTDAFPD